MTLTGEKDTAYFLIVDWCNHAFHSGHKRDVIQGTSLGWWLGCLLYARYFSS